MLYRIAQDGWGRVGKSCDWASWLAALSLAGSGDRVEGIGGERVWRNVSRCEAMDHFKELLHLNRLGDEVVHSGGDAAFLVPDDGVGG
jgi:hypothetical protein